MTAHQLPSFFAAGPELFPPSPFDVPLCLDLVAGRHANQLSVAGALDEQCAGRLSMVLDRLSQLMRPTLVQLHRVRRADEDVAMRQCSGERILPFPAS